MSVVDVDFADVEPKPFDEALEMDRGGPLELPLDNNKSTSAGDDEDENEDKEDEVEGCQWRRHDIPFV